MIVSAIVAMDLNRAIGKDNQLLWHLPADLKFFKSTTMGYPIVMGRKTYESIGRLLPGRRNIIITRNSDYQVKGAEVYHTLEHALQSCTEEKVFIIGGAEIFNQSLHLISELYITSVKSTFEADTFFPDHLSAGFKITWEECHKVDEKNNFDYCFQKWEQNA